MFRFALGAFSRSNDHMGKLLQHKTVPWHFFIYHNSLFHNDMFYDVQVKEEDVSFFKRLLQGRVVTDEDELINHNTDWLRTVRSLSQLVCFLV